MKHIWPEWVTGKSPAPREVPQGEISAATKDKIDKVDEVAATINEAWKLGIIRAGEFKQSNSRENERIDSLEAENAMLREKLEKYELEARIARVMDECQKLAALATLQMEANRSLQKQIDDAIDRWDAFRPLTIRRL